MAKRKKREDLVDLDEPSGVKRNGNDGYSKGGDKEGNESLNLEMDRYFKIAYRNKGDWDEEAHEDIQISLGNQWSTEDRATLEEEGRPVLTFNKINPMINLIVGHLIQNNNRIQVSPEGGEDEKFSRTMDRIIDHIDKQTMLEWRNAFLFAGGQRAGRAWSEFFLDWDDDPIFGSLKNAYQGCFKIYMDPNGNEYDLSDCQYGFKIVKMSRGRLKQLYPKKAKMIDGLSEDLQNPIRLRMVVEGDADNYGQSSQSRGIGLKTSQEPEGLQEETGDQRQLHVLEYWRKKYVQKWFVYSSHSGSMNRYDTKDKAETAAAEAMKAAQAEGAENPKVIVVDRMVTEMHVAIKAGGEVLEDGKSPFEPYYHGFEWFQFISQFAPEADEDEKLKVQGMVRALKDPQREVNKARSSFLHILGTVANSGWIGDDDALTPAQKEELRDFGSKPGITIWKKKGSSLERISPVAPDLANQVREKASTDDFKECSGINADLLSIDSKASPSGKAIALRIRQAITILEPSFANFRYTKRLMGEFLFKIVPMLYDVTRIKKILGAKFLEANQITDTELKSYLIMIQDGKYNVQISEQGTSMTLREETFESLMTMLEKGMQLPPDVIFEFMNIPNKAELLNKVQAYQQQQEQAQLAMAQAGVKKPAG